MIDKLELNVIDTHAHLDMPDFDADREEVIRRAHEAGIVLINTIGIDVESSRRAIELAEKYQGLVASIGISPQEAGGVSEAEISALSGLAGHPRVVAIGELGLDFYHPQPSREEQFQVLRWELDLAQRFELPVIIHCRDAQEDIMPIISNWCEGYALAEGSSRGVLHCFRDDIKTAKWYLERGFFISIGAYIGYPSSSLLRETVRNLPVDGLLIETDCPFLPPQKYRGQRNEPSYIMTTLELLAGLKNLPVEEMARHTSKNAVKLFNLSIA